jgi:integrase
MEIDRHLQKIGDLYWLMFGSDETKQRRETHDFLPLDLVPYIERYLNQHREVLLARAKGASDDRAVWLSENGRRLGAPAISYQVKLRTKKKFGVAIPPHRFRDCLATSVSYELPANVGIGSQMLHHYDPDLMQRHYIQAEARIALGKLHKNLEEIRRELERHQKGDIWTTE